MRRYKLIGTALCAGVLALWGGRADAEEFSARLTGFQELGSLPNVTQNPTTGVVTAANPTGAVLSNGTGTLELDLDEKAGTATWTLTYSNVGTTPPKTGTVSQAHIHFGKSRDSGGILVFFCTNLTPPPVGAPLPKPCPSPSGTVSGTWTSADIVAIAGQNVVAGNFDALVDALESNTAYANIHTTSGTTPDTAFPAGEIRGQIHEGDLDKKHDHHESHDNHEH
jgi:hypothetical protein